MERLIHLFLVNEMLDMLPVDIFKNKNLKWLDPGCGYGYFSIILFKRLLSGLSDVIPDKEEKKTYNQEYDLDDRNKR